MVDEDRWKLIIYNVSASMGIYRIFTVCVWLSCMGALMSIVVPMAIIFPRQAKPFSIFTSNSDAAVKLVIWYANGLKDNTKHYESSPNE
jgi:hypothetical protein